MSMKHPTKFHKAADKKRRLHRAHLKQEARERRQKMRDLKQPPTAARSPSKPGTVAAK